MTQQANAIRDGGAVHPKALHLPNRETRTGRELKMTDRRAVKQQYLQANTRAGVYAIRNAVTGRALVEGSANVNGALNRHRFELRQGTHRNGLLSQDWSQHGEQSFTFEVLDMVKPSEDPAFDLPRELEDLVELWRHELSCHVETGYGK